MKIQDIAPLKMINSIILVPSENDLKDLPDKDFKIKMIGLENRISVSLTPRNTFDHKQWM